SFEELMHLKKGETIKGIFTNKPLGERGGEFRVGIIVPLTVFPEYSKQMIKLVEHTASTINRNGGVAGKELRLIIADDGADKNIAVELVKKMHQQYHIQALIGPTSSSRVISVAREYSVKNRLLVISPSANSDSLSQLDDNDSVFQMMDVASRQGYVMAEFLFKQLSIDKVATIFRRTDYANQVKLSFDSTWQELTNREAPDFSVSEWVDYKSFNLKTELNKTLSSFPEAILLLMSSREATDVAKQIEAWYQHRKKTLPILIVSEGVYDSSFIDSVSSEVLKCTLYSLPNVEERIVQSMEELSQKYQFDIKNVESVYAKDALVLIAYLAEYQFNRKRPFKVENFRQAVNLIGAGSEKPNSNKSNSNKSNPSVELNVDLKLLSSRVAFDEDGFNSNAGYAIWSLRKTQTKSKLSQFRGRFHSCLK
ncbi:MAG: ABC transporter substrate-binding protein, partial [Kangiellaceae bacterium]|nr:ABC transporter substrate-binding protein [Kangiellaceae bacterium]